MMINGTFNIISQFVVVKHLVWWSCSPWYYCDQCTAVMMLAKEIRKVRSVIWLWNSCWEHMNRYVLFCFLLSILKRLIAVCFTISMFYMSAYIASRSRILLKNLTELRYLTYIYSSHNIIWIQDIPHIFQLFLLYSLENQCFTSSLGFFFQFTFYCCLKFCMVNGNILLGHIYLICYTVLTTMSTVP